MTTVFEKETGIKEKDAFFENIALPLQLKDITDSKVLYYYEPGLSIHPVNANNPICKDCQWVEDSDYLELLKLIFSARN